MLAIVAGATLLVIDQGGFGTLNVGILFVVGATALWAVDNALSASLGDLDPKLTVFWKSGVGALCSLLLGRLLHEPFGSVTSAVLLVAIGAIGYGASLVCYLLAQRTFGVARTASVFAIAPFFGASLAIFTSPGERVTLNYAALALMLAGAYLHASERHVHAHRHHSLAHDHVHRHDEPHHMHGHATPIDGSHGHPHTHPETSHTHEHLPNDPDHVHPH